MDISMEHTSSPSPTPMNSPGQSMKILDPEIVYDKTAEYIQAVKQLCGNDEERFRKFSRLVRGFQSGRISPRGLVCGLIQILNKEMGLLLLFNVFLPEGYDYELKPEGIVYTQPGCEPELLMPTPQRLAEIRRVEDGNTSE